VAQGAPRIRGLLGLLTALFTVPLVIGLATTPLRTSECLTAVALVLCGITAVEVAVRLRWVAAPRRTTTLGLLAAWTLPAATLLPPAYSLGVAIVLHGHHAIRARRATPGRLVFSITSAGIAGFTAALAATGTLHGIEALGVPGAAAQPIAIVAAAFTLVFISVGLSLAMARAGGSSHPVRQLLGGRDHVSVELAELTIGALVSVAWIAMPPVIVLALVPEVLLQRSRRHAELEHRARTDAKTGLANHVHWREMAERELARAREDVTPIAVLIVDIDHFKTINDVHGHLVGDEVIFAVARQLTDGLRPRDLVGRFGGEEFVVLLSGTDLQQAHAAAERFRQRISELDLPTGTGGRRVRATVSVGIASHPVNGDSLHELLDAADRAMYAAKRAGRNCVRDAMPTVQQVLDLTAYDQLALLGPMDLPKRA
jgi:diguanylate cyclase (GGDEF)-like protein